MFDKIKWNVKFFYSISSNVYKIAESFEFVLTYVIVTLWNDGSSSSWLETSLTNATFHLREIMNYYHVFKLNPDGKCYSSQEN
jgi:hypothetical protein